MDITTSTSGASTTLQGAILLYETHIPPVTEYGSPQISHSATVHQVEEDDRGRSQIQPGRPLTEKDYVTLLANLGSANTSTTRRWVDSMTLCQSGDRFIWWNKPAKRSMFFKESSMSKASFNAQGVCPVPGLVWMATKQGLYVFAFKGEVRPDPETPLFQAPFLNVWASGQVCVGTATKVKEDDFFDAKAWEQLFFGSHFTHVNFTEKRRLLNVADPNKFWRGMVTNPSETFPQNKLVPVNIKAGNLLRPDILSVLSGMKATGEF